MRLFYQYLGEDVLFYSASLRLITFYQTKISNQKCTSQASDGHGGLKKKATLPSYSPSEGGNGGSVAELDPASILECGMQLSFARSLVFACAVYLVVLLLLLPSISCGGGSTVATGAVSVPVPVALSSASLSYTAVIVGTPSTAKTVTITNQQATALSITSITTSLADYVETNTCGSSLAAGASCTVSLIFTPAAAGTRTGTLTIADNAVTSPQVVNLTGSGTADSLQSIAIAPASSTIAKGLTQQFTATGTYASGKTANITTTSTWTSSGAAATVGSATGLATGAAQGSATITATASGITGSSTLTVGPPTLVSLAVTPASVSLGLNAQEQYTATGTYTDQSTQNLASTATWASGSPSLVKITSPGGLASVLGTSTSAVPITASVGNVTAPVVWLSALSTLPIFCATPTIDMRLLVVNNATSNYADFPAIQQILNYVGTPYTVVDATTTTLPTLSDGSCHGYYQGIIYAFGNDIYTNASLNQALTSYEITFGVRQLNWYVNPTADFGLNNAASFVQSTQTDTATFTAAAAPVFYYANTATPLKITNAFTYLTTPLAPAGGSVTPLLTDSNNYVLSAITQFADGRQYLNQMFDSNPFLTHNLVLAYGLINWVTKGIFLGDYHVYAAAQVDDFFINDSEWVPGTPCTDPITTDRTAPDASILPTFRIKSADMTALATWQTNLQKDALLKNFQLTLAMNGVGTAGNTAWTGVTGADDLVTNLPNYQGFFHWISHTFDHPSTLNNLCMSAPTGTSSGGTVCGDTSVPPLDDIDLEILTNLYVASKPGGVNLDTDPSDAGLKGLTFTDFNPQNLVTPGITGLNDPYVPGYLYTDGIRYVVTDTSVIGQANNGPNPSPNVGIVNSFATGLYEVPRHPNDVYFNAANWNDDQAEFQCIYSYPTVVTPFNAYTAAQILDFTSAAFVTNMLIGDMDPEMFHQPDLHSYCSDATPPSQCSDPAFAGLPHSLLGDVYTQTFQKYEALYKLPVLSPTLDQIGQTMQNRNAYNQSGVTASLVGVNSATPTITITATSPAVVPVTGLNSTGAESYGGKNISHVTVSAGQTISLPVK